MAKYGNIPLHILTTSLSINLWMTQVVSISLLLLVMLQQTEGCIYLFELVFFYSLDKHPEVGLLDLVVALFLIF